MWRSGWMSVAAGLLAVAALLGSGCGREALAGSTGVVTFALSVAHVEAVGVNAPVARGSSLLLTVSSETHRTGAIALEAEGLDGNAVTVFPAGFGRFGLHVPEAGRVQVLAKVDGVVVDALPLEVTEPDALSLSELAVLETQVGECVTREGVSLSDVVLAPNQRLRTFVVPRSRGRALVGLLPLDVTAIGAEVAPLDQSDVVPAHTVELTLPPSEVHTAMSRPVELRVRDHANVLDVRRRIASTGSAARPVACSNRAP